MDYLALLEKAPGEMRQRLAEEFHINDLDARLQDLFLESAC